MGEVAWVLSGRRAVWAPGADGAFAVGQVGEVGAEEAGVSGGCRLGTLAIPRAVVTLVGSQQGGAASGALHHAKTLEGVGSQLFIRVSNPQVLEQLGVDAAPA
jgi:hypothetical protein